MSPRAARAAVVALALGCHHGAADPPPPDGRATLRDPVTRVAGDAARGRALVERYECARCHDGAGGADVARDRHCVRCHQEIHAGRFDAPPDVLARWRAHIVHLRDAPSLADLGARLDPAWVARFLVAPHAVRPSLGAEMPRLDLDPAAANDIAAWLARPPAAPGAFRGDAARGRARYAARGCGTCHVFTGAPSDAARPLPPGVVVPDPARAVRLAPDLRHARDRWRPSAVVAQLRAPRATTPDGAMPDLGLSDEEARDLAAYVLTVPLAPPPRAPVPPRLPVLARPVGFDEVQARVLRRTCWHCHGDPDFARGEGGPGNTGGFGFRPRGVDLAHYEGVLSGGLDAAGERRSLVRPAAGGAATLVRVLLARQREVAGAPEPGVRGMPLGLPPLSPEDVQLVESWVAQGCPE